MNRLNVGSQNSDSNRNRGIIAIAFTLCLAVSLSAFAQNAPELARFGGQYVYDGSRDDGVEIVERAVDKAMREQNMVVRALAKRGFTEHFATTVLIEVPPGKIGLKVGDLDKVTQDIGKTEVLKGKDGKQGRLVYRFENGTIVSTWLGDDATIRTVFTLSSDGKSLERDVKVESTQMSKPVSYRLKYKRK